MKIRTLICSSTALVAGLLMLGTGGAAAQTGVGRQVGVAAGVTGPVQLVAAAPGARTAGRNVQSGEPIRIGDQIATGPDGRLQIMLLDETIFTIGPNAALTIDEFVFDSKSGAGKLSANVARGAFRFVTGRIAANNPQDMQVKTPVGTMGIRGTVVGGWVSDDRARIVLLGPGSQNNAAERMGRVFVQGNVPQGNGVELRRPGFATEIVGRNGQPSAPFRLPQSEIESLIRELSNPLTRAANSLRDGEDGDGAEQLAEVAPAAGGGLAGGDMTRLSGQHIVDFLRPLICSSCEVVLTPLPTSGSGGTGGTGGPGGSGDPTSPPASVFGTRPTLPEIATFRGSITFGTTSFSLVPVGEGATSGRYDVTASFDFETRRLTGTLSVVLGALDGRVAFSGEIVPPGSSGPAAAPSRALGAVSSTSVALSRSTAPGTVDVPLFGGGVKQTSDGWIDFRFVLEKSPGSASVDRLANGLLVSRFVSASDPMAPLAVGGGLAKAGAAGGAVPLTDADRSKLLTDLGLKR
ncbi:MAG: FecR domain-containing protein [Alphaproteobacteria bacterium]|nr:FecR domain-containing protein [Alphaproteobacteria bacterium]